MHGLVSYSMVTLLKGSLFESYVELLSSPLPRLSSANSLTGKMPKLLVGRHCQLNLVNVKLLALPCNQNDLPHATVLSSYTTSYLSRVSAIILSPYCDEYHRVSR